MELGNMIFGHSRGNVPIERQTGYENALWMLLEMAGYDSYGCHDSENPGHKLFTVRPYYWGDCDCGWEKITCDWSETHKHSADCYQTVSYKRIKESPLQIEREQALKARDRLPFGKHDKEQKKVEEVCNRLSAFEQQVRKELCKQHNIPWDGGKGCAVHCTCSHDKDWENWCEANKLGEEGHADTCATVLPNFVFNGIDSIEPFVVRWYKYPLRDSYMSREVSLQEWNKAMKACMDSL